MRRSEAGYSLVALAAGMTIMFIMMGAAASSWKYVMQNAREEELLFRGGQIADAIERYQKKQGGGTVPPVSLDVLVKGKFLRKAYKDPMTEKGQWRFIRPGEAVPGMTLPSAGGAMQGGATPGGATRGGQTRPSPSPSPGRDSRSRSAFGESIGPFLGVASTSQEKSLRIFNNKTRYDQWVFMAGQPRVVGKDNLNMMGGRVPGQRRPGGVNPQPTR